MNKTHCFIVKLGHQFTPYLWKVPTDLTDHSASEICWKVYIEIIRVSHVNSVFQNT